MTYLTLSCWFNQLLENIDLKNVTYLNFGWGFNQSLENVDLKNVTHLTLTEAYEHTNEKFVDHIYKFNIRKITIFNGACKIKMVNKNKSIVKNTRKSFKK